MKYLINLAVNNTAKKAFLPVGRRANPESKHENSSHTVLMNLVLIQYFKAVRTTLNLYKQLRLVYRFMLTIKLHILKLKRRSFFPKIKIKALRGSLK